MLTHRMHKQSLKEKNLRQDCEAIRKVVLAGSLEAYKIWREKFSLKHKIALKYWRDLQNMVEQLMSYWKFNNIACNMNKNKCLLRI